MTTMKMGMVIFEGTEKEMQKEYNKLLEKAREGYENLVYEFEDDKLGTFKIEDTNIKVTFSLSKSLNDKYAVYQILE